jgi:hypothetical protein
MGSVFSSPNRRDLREPQETRGVSVPTNRFWFLRPGLVMRFVALVAVIILLAEWCELTGKMTRIP